MCQIDEMADRWERALADMEPTVGVCMEEQKEQIIGLNTKQLYDEGVDAKGVKLPPYKDPAYAAKKAEMRGGLMITDAYLTGAFQSAFDLAVNGPNYIIDSHDEKADMLRNKKGWYDIFGLTEDNKGFAWDNIICDPYIDKLKEQTGCE